MNDYFFSRFLLDLQARLTAHVPELKFIDQNTGQLGQYSEHGRPPIDYPALLIDFPNTTYSEAGHAIQLGAVQMVLQLVFDNYAQTWQKAPLKVREAGFNYLDIEQKVFKSLHGWSLDYFTPLTRSGVRSQNNNDLGLRVREMTFLLEYEDWTLGYDDEKNVEFRFSGSIKK